ncbi:MAG: hypothetical protein ACI35W_02090 [Anaeroplasmataceae bacterium]
MLTNGRFQGTIGGKELSDYKKMIDWDINNEEKRLELINNIFNLDEIGSTEEFWQEIWNCGICKVNLDKISVRWDETDVSKFLETVGSYFIYGYDKKEKKNNKELELFETMSYDDIDTDKNYRLAPPNKIEKSDFKVRELFAGTYEEYVEKVSKTRYEIKEKESWERIKHNEKEKIRFLTEAQRNLNILKKQMEELKLGKKLQYNKNIEIQVPKMNIEIKLSKQLERYGLSNDNILRIENKIYKHKTRSTNVKLFHLQSNLKDMKDYMISCKLSYTNRVMIKPSKCPTVKHVLELTNYFDPSHIRGMLMLGERKLDPSSDMAIVAFDINNKIREMHSNGELSDRDMYIIEGMQFNVSYETIGKELNIKPQNVDKAITRMCNNIAQSFYNDYISLYFLNESKGKYKKCNKCGEVKLINQFDIKRSNKDGYKNHCKKCNR